MRTFHDIIDELESRFPGDVEVIRPNQLKKSIKLPLLIFGFLLIWFVQMFLVWILTDVSFSEYGAALLHLYFNPTVALDAKIFAWTPVVLVCIWITRQRFRRKVYARQIEHLNADRPYLLFLRSFADDRDTKDAAGVSRLETEILKRFSDQYPFVAIANTQEPGRSGGAVRVKTSDNAWRTAVELLSANAVAVFIDARSATSGLLEEIETHLNNGARRCSNIIIILRDFHGRAGKTSVDIVALLERSDHNAKIKVAEGETPALCTRIGDAITVHGGPRKIDSNLFMSMLRAFLNKISGKESPADKLGFAAEVAD